jgi:hypothetical protein
MIFLELFTLLLSPLFFHFVVFLHVPIWGSFVIVEDCYFMSSPFSHNTRSHGICDAFLMQCDEAIMIVRLISFFILFSLFMTLLWRSLAELRKRTELGENISVWMKREWIYCLHFAAPMYDRRDCYSLKCRHRVDPRIFQGICIRDVAQAIRNADRSCALSVGQAEMLDLLPSSGQYCFLYERSFVQFLVRT